MTAFIRGARFFALSLLFRFLILKYLFNVFELDISVFNEFMAEETGYLFFGDVLPVYEF